MTLPTVVLAGGLGTRISAITGNCIPKVLVDVAGRPFLDRKLHELAAQGVEEVILLTGHQGNMVQEHLAINPPIGLRVLCVDDGPRLLGTGGAIAAAIAPPVPKSRGPSSTHRTRRPIGGLMARCSWTMLPWCPVRRITSSTPCAASSWSLRSRNGRPATSTSTFGMQLPVIADIRVPSPPASTTVGKVIARSPWCLGSRYRK